MRLRVGKRTLAMKMSDIVGSLATVQEQPSTRRWAPGARAAVVFFSFYVVSAVLYGAQWGLDSSAQGPVDWAHTMALSAVSWGTPAVASVPLVWLAWRQRIEASAFYRA